MGHTSLISRLGRSPGVGNGNLLQSFCLENPLDRGAWWAAVHRVTKSQTRLSAHTTIYFTVSQKLCSSFLNLNQLNNCDELPTGGSEVKASAFEGRNDVFFIFISLKLERSVPNIIGMQGMCIQST